VVANPEVIRISGYFRVGGNLPPTQESAFQWIRNLSMRDMASIENREILITTSAFEQKLKAELVQAIQHGKVAMLGLLRQELLSGIKEKAQFDRVKAALDPYLDEPINTADHEYAARVYNECRNQAFRPARSIF
jgi:hypothetical protein